MMGEIPKMREEEWMKRVVFLSQMKPSNLQRLSDLAPNQCGVIERVDTPEEVMTLIQMGCCIGADVEVRHVSPQGGPMAICTCGRTLSVRKEAAQHLWVRPAAQGEEVA